MEIDWQDKAIELRRALPDQYVKFLDDLVDTMAETIDELNDTLQRFYEKGTTCPYCEKKDV